MNNVLRACSLMVNPSSLGVRRGPEESDHQDDVFGKAVVDQLLPDLARNMGSRKWSRSWYMDTTRPALDIVALQHRAKTLRQYGGAP
jgi:hypothetical protein